MARDRPGTARERNGNQVEQVMTSRIEALIVNTLA